MMEEKRRKEVKMEKYSLLKDRKYILKNVEPDTIKLFLALDLVKITERNTLSKSEEIECLRRWYIVLKHYKELGKDAKTEKIDVVDFMYSN